MHSTLCLNKHTNPANRLTYCTITQGYLLTHTYVYRKVNSTTNPRDIFNSKFNKNY